MRNKIIVFDLDDTLYKEIDFLKSAYKEIANTVKCDSSPQEIYTFMVDAYKAHLNVFEEMISKYQLNETVEELLSVYRNHYPIISLSKDTEETLATLSQHFILGMITDGRSVTQRQKMKALGLSRFFGNDNILISEEFGFAKPSAKLYCFFMDKYPNMDYSYIGDNINKDFVTPNQLGWTTYCLINNGENIHSQDAILSNYYMPKYNIFQLSSIMNFIKQI